MSNGRQFLTICFLRHLYTVTRQEGDGIESVDSSLDVSLFCPYCGTAAIWFGRLGVGGDGVEETDIEYRLIPIRLGEEEVIVKSVKAMPAKKLGWWKDGPWRRYWTATGRIETVE
ncbi:TPA: hypothetical protein DF272_05875 [Candidatus Falkowbacteria bacterium]|nr:hypothetical protein [Candidatus Falkowbacteria bacterium]